MGVTDVPVKVVSLWAESVGRLGCDSNVLKISDFSVAERL